MHDIEYQIFRVKLENPLFLLASHKLHDIHEILHILEYAKKQGRSLIVAAEDIDGEVLSTLILNKEKAELSCCAINFPGESNYSFLEDLAGYTGAVLHNHQTIDNLKVEDLGTCQRANIDSMKSNFIAGKGDITLRKLQISNELANETDILSQTVLRERLQRLSGKMAIIEIGLSGGKLAIGERRDRIVDSLNSVKSAVKEGFLPGGGVSLLYASKILSKLRYNNESDIGIRILQEALVIPSTIIARTSSVGIGGVDTIMDQTDEEIGIDAVKGEICNLVDRGIIDSTGIVRQSVRAAVSVAHMILSSSAVIAKTIRYEPVKLNKYKKQQF